MAKSNDTNPRWVPSGWSLSGTNNSSAVSQPVRSLAEWKQGEASKSSLADLLNFSPTSPTTNSSDALSTCSTRTVLSTSSFGSRGDDEASRSAPKRMKVPSWRVNYSQEMHSSTKAVEPKTPSPPCANITPSNLTHRTSIESFTDASQTLPQPRSPPRHRSASSAHYTRPLVSSSRTSPLVPPPGVSRRHPSASTGVPSCTPHTSARRSSPPHIDASASFSHLSAVSPSLTPSVSPRTSIPSSTKPPLPKPSLFPPNEPPPPSPSISCAPLPSLSPPRAETTRALPRRHSPPSHWHNKTHTPLMSEHATLNKRKRGDDSGASRGGHSGDVDFALLKQRFALLAPKPDT